MRERDRVDDRERSSTPRWTDGPSDGTELARVLAPAGPGVEALEQLAGLAARLLDVPSGHVALISDVQTVLGGVGSSAEAVGNDAAAEDSVCAVTVAIGAPLVVHDASTDVRTRDLAPVRSGVVGSYLGIPLRVRDQLVGSLCVYGPEARVWTPQDVELLQRLSAPAVAELQMVALSAEHEDERLLWQLAVDAAGVGAFDWNLETGALRWDDRLLDLFGLDRRTFGGTIEAFNDAVHPEDRDRVGAALQAAIDSCGVYEAEYRIVLPSGELRWVRARGRGIAGPDGSTATRVLGAAFDTTAVQDGEAQVARVLETMSTAFYHLDLTWRFTYLNAEAHRLLGGIGVDIVGRNVWELFPGTVDSDFELHYRRAMETGQPVEFEAYYPPPLDRWYEIRGLPSPDGLSVYFLDITRRREAEAEASSAAERAVLLASVTDDLTRDLDIDEAAGNLARAVVGAWADWSIVTLVDHPDAQVTGTETPARTGRTWRRGLRDVAAWHLDPTVRPLIDRYRAGRLTALTDDAFLAQALREDRPIVIAADATGAIADVLHPGEARDLFLQLAPTSTVVVPLRGRGRTVGLLTVFRGDGRGPFTPDDVTDLAAAGARAGLALDNLRLYAQQRDLAEALQRSLMTAPPVSDLVRVAVRYEPAAEVAQVGGDWYDAFLQTDGATNIVIGDVVGHDTQAAAAMGQVRGLLRGIAVSTEDGPSSVLERVDRAMETLQVHTTATAVVARLEQGTTGSVRLRWSNAGHPPPLVAAPAATSADVEVTALWPERTELMLGITSAFARTDAVVTLAPGSTVLLYTDGLVERRGELLDEGIDRLRGVLAELVAADLTLEDLCDELVQRMLLARPEDDVAIVAVRLRHQD